MKKFIITEEEKTRILKMHQNATVKQYRRWLRAACTSRRGAGLTQISPPVVLFIWPNVFSGRGVISDLNLSHQMFYRDLSDRVIVADFVFNQIRNETNLPTAEDILSGED